MELTVRCLEGWSFRGLFTLQFPNEIKAVKNQQEKFA